MSENSEEEKKRVIKDTTLKNIYEKPVTFKVEDENILIIKRPKFEVSK